MCVCVCVCAYVCVCEVGVVYCVCVCVCVCVCIRRVVFLREQKGGELFVNHASGHNFTYCFHS